MSRNFDKVKDGGAMTAFSTGSKRDVQDGKGKFFLISTIALRRLAKHYENGAKKYASRNWEKGQPLSQYLDSCFRHLVKTIDGLNDEDHAAAVMWNMAAFIHTLDQIESGVLPAELNDMQEYWEKMRKHFAWVEEQEKGK
jgi:hypothetical protein